MGWLFLALAILVEVAGTLSLRRAADGARRWNVVAGVAYVVSFTFLRLALGRGIGIGVAYGIWTASGVALITVLGRVLFGERIGRRRAAGLALVVAGVALVELGAPH